MISVFIITLISLVRYVLLVFGTLRDKAFLFIPHLIIDAFVAVSIAIFIGARIVELSSGGKVSAMELVLPGSYLVLHMCCLRVTFMRYRNLEYEARVRKRQQE